MRYYNLILTFLIVALGALAVPMHPSASDAYSGVGGNALGGSVNQSPDAENFPGIASILSGNAGNGGDASSGDAVVGNSFHKGAKGSPEGDNTYTGAGGTAVGGSVNGAGKSLIDILSYNAGGGGDASSGSSLIY